MRAPKRMPHFPLWAPVFPLDFSLHSRGPPQGVLRTGAGGSFEPPGVTNFSVKRGGRSPFTPPFPVGYHEPSRSPPRRSSRGIFSWLGAPPQGVTKASRAPRIEALSPGTSRQVPSVSDGYEGDPRVLLPRFTNPGGHHDKLAHQPVSCGVTLSNRPTSDRSPPRGKPPSSRGDRTPRDGAHPG